MTGLLTMTRPQACVAAGTASLLGSHLEGVSLNGRGPWIAGVVVVLIVAACNVVNDVVDVRADAIDRPDRPLVSGRAGTRSALVLMSLLSLGGLVSAASLGAGRGLVALAFLLAGVAYSLLVRRVALLCHVWVAMMFGATVIWGAWATAGTTGSVWTAGILVALFLLPREMLKSLGDVRGDSEAGWRTAAVLWGPELTMRALMVTALVFALATIAPLLVGTGGAGYMVVIWVGTVLPLLVLVAWLHRHVEGRLRRAEHLTALMWIPGLAALWQLGPIG